MWYNKRCSDDLPSRPPNPILYAFGTYAPITTGPLCQLELYRFVLEFISVIELAEKLPRACGMFFKKRHFSSVDVLHLLVKIIHNYITFDISHSLFYIHHNRNWISIFYTIYVDQCEALKHLYKHTVSMSRPVLEIFLSLLVWNFWPNFWIQHPSFSLMGNFVFVKFAILILKW